MIGYIHSFTSARFRRRVVLCSAPNGSDKSGTYRNSIGVHSLVFAGGMDEASIRRSAKGAVAAGFDVLELPMLETNLDTGMIRSVLEEHRLVPTCSTGLSFEIDISSEDGEKVAKGEKFLNEALDQTSEIGSKYGAS